MAALPSLPVTLAKLSHIRTTGRSLPCLIEAAQLRRLSMHQRTIRSILTIFPLAIVSATIALAQSITSSEVPAIATNNSWQATQLAGSSKGKLYVVTLDQPHRRQTCRIQSFTMDKLVCSHTIGGPRTYLPQQIAALIVPGDDGLKVRLVLGLNGGIAAAIWGTVVLAVTCPA